MQVVDRRTGKKVGVIALCMKNWGNCQVCGKAPWGQIYGLFPVGTQEPLVESLRCSDHLWS